MGMDEITKYYIPYGFSQASDMTNIINLDTWNSLPKHLQDLIIDVQLELEVGPYEAFMKELEDKAWQTFVDAGIEVIEFSPADAEWFVNLYYESSWDDLIERTGETSSKLRELYLKAKGA